MTHPARTLKVMVVDDSFLIRNILKNILKQDDSVSLIAEASNGEEALLMLEAAKSPDIILLDIDMPVMNGLQFMRSPRLKTQAKIIIISSLSRLDSAEAKEAMALGACEIINKPSGVLSVDLGETKSKEILDCIHRCAQVRNERAS